MAGAAVAWFVIVVPFAAWLETRRLREESEELKLGDSAMGPATEQDPP
jgi:hypothetical protein